MFAKPLTAAIFIGVGLALVIGASVGLAILGQLPLRRRLAALAATRDPHLALARFHAALADVPERLRQDSYGLIQGVVPVPNFPVLPEDDLWRDLDLDQGNVDNAFESYFEHQSLIAPANPLWPCSTAADFARLLHRCMTQAQPGGHV